MPLRMSPAAHARSGRGPSGGALCEPTALKHGLLPPASRHVVPRLFDPPSFIGPGTEQNLAKLPGFAWDVVTAVAFLKALGITDKMVANRWLFRQPPGCPPFEPTDLWRAGRGGPRVIRKDRAMAWARSQGIAVPGRECWIFAATDLERLGWPGLSGPDQVQEHLDFLIERGIVSPAYPPQKPIALKFLYR